MMFKDKTFCASKNCKNKCGRAIPQSLLEDTMYKYIECMLSIGYFCDEDGELINEI